MWDETVLPARVLPYGPRIFRRSSLRDNAVYRSTQAGGSPAHQKGLHIGRQRQQGLEPVEFPTRPDAAQAEHRVAAERMANEAKALPIAPSGAPAIAGSVTMVGSNGEIARRGEGGEIQDCRAVTPLRCAFRPGRSSRSDREPALGPSRAGYIPCRRRLWSR